MLQLNRKQIFTLIFLLIFGAALLAAFFILNSQLLNLSGPADLPSTTTLLPTFSVIETLESQEGLTSTAIPEELLYVSSFPDTGDYDWQLVAEGFDQPVFLTHAGGQSGRLFVVEQPGLIRILQDGELLVTPFLDLRDRVGSNGSEQGLLGLAFHPQYQQNGFFFVNYTDRNGHTIIARYRVSADRNIADPATEMRLLVIEQPYANHNGGMLAFGPDGYLYIGMGDGGAAADPEGNAQNPDSFLGKMLRLDVDRGEPYAVPSDNPFIAGNGLSEIFLTGLRNPWRFSFDAVTGNLYIADVGQSQYEEINILLADTAAGVNLGWDYFEGFHNFEGNAPAGIIFTEPATEYSHDLGCSVTGGYVYRGSALPDWWGIYFYGDYCTGLVWGLLPDSSSNWQSQLLFETDALISSFGQDQAGEIYLIDYSGSVFRLEANP